jgi:hypothetical protein
MDLDLSKLVISNQVKERKEPAAMVPTAVLVMRDIEHTEDEEVHSPSSPLPFSRQISGLRLREMKLDDTQHHALEDEFASTGGMQTPVIVPKLNLSGFHRVRSDEDLLVSTPKISGRGSEIGQTGSAFQQLSARSNQSSQVSSARSNFSVTSETSYSLNSGPNSTRRYNSNASDIPTAPA